MGNHWNIGACTSASGPSPSSSTRSGSRCSTPEPRDDDATATRHRGAAVGLLGPAALAAGRRASRRLGKDRIAKVATQLAVELLELDKLEEQADPSAN